MRTAFGEDVFWKIETKVARKHLSVAHQDPFGVAGLRYCQPVI